MAAIIQRLELREMLSVAPTVTTPTSAGITSTAATLGGDVVSDGGSTLTDVGVLFAATAANSDPQLGGTGVTQVSTTAGIGIFTVTASNLTPGASYSFVAYATNVNGTTYTPVSTLTSGPDHAPTEVGIPSGPANPFIGTTANLSALGADVDTGEGSLTYTWSLTGTPPAPVTYSIDGTNAAKNTTVTFSASGSYNFMVTLTDPSGESATDTLFLTVNTAVTSLPFALYNVPSLPLPYGGTNTTLVVPGVSIYDPNSANLIQATVQITGNYQAGRDVLGVDLMLGTTTVSPEIYGITSSFDPTSGILTLSGTSSIRNYQSVLQSITYQTETLVSSTFTQTITITLNDGTSVTAPVTRTILVNAPDNVSYPIACLGDSLTFWPGGWVSMLQSYYSTPNVTNFGSGGYTTQQIYNTWETEVRGDGYQMISVLGGVNDVAHGVSAATAFSYLDEIYDEAMSDGVKVIAFSMTPLAGWDVNSISHWSPQIQTQIELLNSMIAAKVAANPGQMLFCDTYTLMGDPTNPEILNPIYNNGDGLHWNIAGHQLMVSTFYAEFTSTFGPAAAMLATPSVAAITDTSAVLGGNVFSNGGSTINGCGVVYALTSDNTNPQIGGTSVTNIPSTGTTGPFTINVTGLTPGSSYSFEAYATSSNGITYTPVATFSTLASPSISVLPSIQTYIKGPTPLPIAPNLLVGDPTGLGIAGAIVTITNWNSNEDRLSFYNSAALHYAIVLDDNTNAITLTLTGSASAVAYRTELQSLSYQDVNFNLPILTARNVTITITNSASRTASATTSIIVQNVNLPPAVTSIETTAVTYAANTSPVAITATALVNDLDSATLSQLTIQITSGYQNGADFLSFTNQNGITGSFNASSGMLTLTGNRTPGYYRVALQSVMFSSAGTAANRTLSIIAYDNLNLASTTATRTVSVSAGTITGPAVSGLTSPVVLTIAGGPVQIAPNLVLNDFINRTVSSATVTVTNWNTDNNGEDVLGITNSAGLTISKSTNSQHILTLTLSGTNSLAAYQAELRSLTFNDLQANVPVLTPRQFSLSFTDSAAVAATADSATITLQGTSTPTLSALSSFTEPYGGFATYIAPNLTLSDTPDGYLTSATITVTNWDTVSNGSGGGQRDEDRLGVYNYASLNLGNILSLNGGNFTPNSNKSVTFTLSGINTVAYYQLELRSLTYQDVEGLAPATPLRTFTISLTDGYGNSATSNTSSVTLQGNTSTLAVGNLSNTTFTAGSATPITIDPNATLGDLSSTNSGIVTGLDIVSAVVQINNWNTKNNGEDSFFWSNLGALQHTQTVSNGVFTLTLTGTNSVANYLLDLRSMVYEDLTPAALADTKTVTITVTDSQGNPATGNDHVSSSSSTITVT